MATTEAPVLASQKFRKYVDGQRRFYLSKGSVTENGKPRVSVPRWNADYILKDVKGAPITLPTLRDYWVAAGQDSEAKQSIFSFPAEWTSHFILNPNAPTETDKYVLRDADGKPLTASRRARLLNPTGRQKDGEKEIVHAIVFDLPFELKGGFYNGLEDLDPETGFLKQVSTEGQFYVWFGSDSKLYASILLWNGDVYCYWGPSHSVDSVGLRGRSTGNQGQFPAELLESEFDVLRSQLERVRQEKAEDRRALRGKLEELEAHYRSGLEQLTQLKTDLQDQE